MIVVVGGRTGRDGIHGATFSSVELHEDSETVDAAAVQIGDAIQEKRVLDGLLLARDAKQYRGLTDCGAGGLSSAVGEMGATTGAEVDLDLVPLKYPGLTPEEIWISEAQERMVLAVPPENVEACIATFATEDCEATAIGHFTDTGRLVLRYESEVVGDMSMDFLHEGTPRPTRQASWSPPELAEPRLPAAQQLIRRRQPRHGRLERRPIGPTRAAQHRQQEVGHTPVRPRGPRHERGQAPRGPGP